MFPMMGSPFGPGGYGSFLLRRSKKTTKTERAKRRKSMVEGSMDCRVNSIGVWGVWVERVNEGEAFILRANKRLLLIK